jgi:hypothetical protein
LHEISRWNFAGATYPKKHRLGPQNGSSDAGASSHVSQPTSQPRQAHAFKAEERRNPRFDLKLNVIKLFKLLSWEAVLCTGIEVNRL